MEKIPLVSVIIPMYNAEKYISQTLESLLYQTLKDFEVIVVDDCSTDNSVALAENYINKFKGGGDYNLSVIKLPTNSGTPEIPRNIGIKFSRGKYITFLDNDDLFTETALEELTTLAEKYQADVVHNDEFFFLDDTKLKSETTKTLISANHAVVRCNPTVPRLDKPTFAPDNFSERIKLWLNSEFHWATWSLFCRRDFWIANQINFPIMPVSGDIIANFACLCFAKKLLRVPNITYINRFRANSVSHANEDLGKYFHKWLNNLIVGFNELNKVMNRVPFFSEHFDYRYAVLNWFFELVIRDSQMLRAAYAQIHPAALSPLVEKEFPPDYAAFAAYLFNTVNIQRLEIERLRRELKKFQTLKD